MQGTSMGNDKDYLTIDEIHRDLDWFRIHLDPLNFHRSQFIWEINEESIFQVKQLEVIASLNSIDLVEFRHRLQLDDYFTINNNICPNVTNVLALVVDRYNTLGLVVHAQFPQGDFESAMVHAFGITGA